MTDWTPENSKLMKNHQWPTSEQKSTQQNIDSDWWRTEPVSHPSTETRLSWISARMRLVLAVWGGWASQWWHVLSATLQGTIPVKSFCLCSRNLFSPWLCATVCLNAANITELLLLFFLHFVSLFSLFIWLSSELAVAASGDFHILRFTVVLEDGTGRC